MRGLGARGAALLATAFLWCGGAQAGTYSLIVENDVITGTDRNYTAGHQLSWISDARRDPDDLVTGGFGRMLAGTVYGLDAIRDRNEDGDPDTDILMHESFTLGHSIFTPEDISTPDPLPRQHPYAGYLYAGYSLVMAHRHMIDTFALDVGLIGPSAFGKEVQQGWHELIDGEEPRGWDNQLHDEPILNFTYQRQWRYVLYPAVHRFGADILPSAGASLGNARTQANLGATLRVGYNLGRDYGPPRIRPALAGSAILDHGNDGFAFYLFGGVEGRAVLRNIFLDGNSFRDSLGVQRKPLVADFQVGAAFQTRAFQIAYTFVIRTEEFDGQINPQKFGAVSLSARF